MRRSWERMKNLEGRLRAGMTANGIDAATQDKIVQHISSFALYGFPESHAASFALIAYASAYIKVKYLAAFTCAILNNQPMGFLQCCGTCERCAAARPAREAHRRANVGVALHH
jgi:error-prone DNA polymerase